MHFLSVLCLVVLLSACKQNNEAPPLMVVDLDAVAKAQGRDDYLQQQMQVVNQKLTNELQSITKNLQAQVDSEKEKLGKDPKPEEQKKHQLLVVEANQKILETRRLAQQKYQDIQNAMVIDFRKEVSVIAKNIATREGGKVVITVNSTTLWFDPTIDITDEVIAEMRAIAFSKADSIEETKPSHDAN